MCHTAQIQLSSLRREDVTGEFERSYSGDGTVKAKTLNDLSAEEPLYLYPDGVGFNDC